MFLDGIPEAPHDLPWHWREAWNAMRNAILELRPSQIPPTPPTNVTVTPMAGGNLVQFTRSDGDQYVLYWNDIPSVNGSIRIDLGQANEYLHEIGAVGVRIYYWIKAKKGQMESVLSGVKTGTTLALGTVVVPPEPPAASEFPVTSDETGEILPGRPTSQGYFEP